MKWVFRPTVLLTVSILLVGTAALVSLPRNSLAHPTAKPVPAGDVEIAWIYPASNSSSWELFVRGVRHVGESARPEQFRVDDRLAFPAQTTAIPEVTLTLTDSTRSKGPRRLVFRWYKLTGDWRAEGWVKALLERNPPPLAVIGGNNSYWARELAIYLKRKTTELWGEDRSQNPLLFLTSATADTVSLEKHMRRPRPGEPDFRPALHELYPERTFRFCFTNDQMARAVTRFVWSRDELRPDVDQLFSVQWEDDVYPQDLAARFTVACEKANYRWLQESALRESLGALGFAAGGVLPVHPLVGPALAELRGWQRADLEQLRLAGQPIHLSIPFQRIDSSVGTFASANFFETKVVRDLLDSLLQKQVPGGTHRLTGTPGVEAPPAPVTSRRPLLMVTGQEQPTRRLLRDLARSAPYTARRCVVVTGDVLTFNTIYRDRRVSWPVPDLPYSLVFFCHYNPIDQDLGFPDLKPARPQAEGQAISGTDDRLLPVEIVETLVQVCSPIGMGDEQPTICNPAEVCRRLKALPWSPPAHKREAAASKLLLFQEDGQRRGGTGEHVVYLQPRFQGDQVLRNADVEVWSLQGAEDQPRQRAWKLVDKLEVSWKDPLELGQP